MDTTVVVRDLGITRVMDELESLCSEMSVSATGRVICVLQETQTHRPALTEAQPQT